MGIFNLSNQLMSGNLITDFKDYKTYIFVKSAFTSGLYNFICPISSIEDFEWQLAESLIADNKKESFQFSYYLKKDSNYPSYQMELERKGYAISLQDRYLLNSIKEPYADNFEEFLLIDESTFPEFLRISAICFPDWKTNDQFCRILFATQNSLNTTKAHNFLIRRNNNVVGVCSQIYSKELNLAYQTNIGTIPEFRGQGIQKRAIKYLCNQALQDGITNNYTIVEPESVSHSNYQKVGFQEEAAFDIFSK